MIFGQQRKMVAEFDADNRKFLSAVRENDQATQNYKRNSEQAFGDIDRSAQTTTRAMLKIGAATVALGAGAAILALQRYAGTARDLSNQMRAIGASSDVARERIYALAIETRTPIEATVGLLRQMQKSLSTQDLETTIRQVGTLNRLLTVGGLDSNARGSVALQFGQALQSGVLAGDELKSLREAAPIELLEAIAEAAGGSIETLRDLGSQGKLTRDVMVQALENLEARSKALFGGFDATLAEGSEALRTGLVAIAGELDKGLGATDLIANAQFKLGNFLLRNAGAMEEFGNAMKIVVQVAGALAGGAALSAVITRLAAVQTTAISLVGTMRILQGVMAFFGGPVGLAIAAVGLAFVAVRNQAKSTQDQIEGLNGSLAAFEAAVNSVDQVNGELEASKDALAAASERYQATLDGEGPAAQRAAAEEVAAINTRIGALEVLREARLREAQLARADVQADAQELIRDAQQQARDTLVDRYAENFERDLLAEGTSNDPQGRALGLAQGVVDNIENDSPVIQRLIDERIADIEEKLTRGLEIGENDLEFYRAITTLQAADARVSILDQEVARVTAGEATADAAAQVAEVTGSVDTLREAAKGLGGSISSGVSQSSDEYRELGQEVRTVIDAQRDLAEVDARKGIQSVADEVQKLAREVGLTTRETEDFQSLLAELDTAGTFDEQAEAIARVINFLEEATGGASNMNDEARAVYDSLLDALQQAIALSDVDVGSGIRGASADAIALADELGIALSIAVAIQNMRDAGSRLAAPGGPDQAVAAVQNEYDTSNGETVLVNGQVVRGVVSQLNVNPPSRRARGGGGGGRSGGGGQSDAEREAEQELNEARRTATSLIERMRTEEEARRVQLQELAEARETLVEQYGEEADIVTELDEATRRLGETGEDAFAGMLNNIGQMIVQGDKLGDILSNVVVQLLQANGTEFFKTLFGGGGLGNSFGALFGGGVQEFARGGIAGPNSPQVAIFGEGSMAEAYVPLPDGRTIPVTLQMPDLDRLSRVPTGSSAGMSVVIHEAATDGPPRVEYDEGSGRMDIFLRDNMRGQFADGSMDGVMRQRYGVKPGGN